MKIQTQRQKDGRANRTYALQEAVGETDLQDPVDPPAPPEVIKVRSKLWALQGMILN